MGDADIGGAFNDGAAFRMMSCPSNIHAISPQYIPTRA